MIHNLDCLDASGNAHRCPLFDLNPSHSVWNGKKDDALVQPVPPLPLMDAQDAQCCSGNFLDVQLGFSSPSIVKATSPPDVREVIVKDS